MYEGSLFLVRVVLVTFFHCCTPTLIESTTLFTFIPLVHRKLVFSLPFLFFGLIFSCPLLPLSLVSIFPRQQKQFLVGTAFRTESIREKWEDMPQMYQQHNNEDEPTIYSSILRLLSWSKNRAY